MDSVLPSICSIIDHSGKNSKVAHARDSDESESLMFLTHFDAFFDLSIAEQTHCNMESVCFIQRSEKKYDKLIPRTA